MSVVRVEWAAYVTARCQAIVTDLSGIDTRRFARLFDRLADDLPAPSGAAERVFLRDRLRAFTDAGGRHFHDRYHQRTGLQPCRGRAIAEAMAVWTNGCATTDPRRLLREWSRVYLSAFESEHATPYAVLAAPRRRADFHQGFDMDAMSAAAGAQRSVDSLM